ncbi:MAG: SDR family oxidoreductase [Halothiobacillaceae bacterium]|nr:SDR family oxidoreductase [Halothiobacillaceae bacterium]
MNRTLLLTGGTGKFGQVLVRHFAESGWTVVTTSREQSRADRLVSDIGPARGIVMGIAADLRLPCGPQRLVDELSSRGIVVTHLVNNARSIETLAVQPDGTTQRDAFIGEFELDVVVPYELTMSLARASSHRLQTVVNIGSMYGEVAPNPALYDGTLDRSPVQYGVSKAGLHHLTRELAVRLAPQHIRVNCVAYGGVGGRVDEAFLARYAQLVPSRRMLRDSEIVGPVEFLLEESSSSVNGHVLVADGGWSAW